MPSALAVYSGGLHLLDDADQVGAVRQVAVVQREALVVHMRILVQVVDAVGVEQAGASLDAVHVVALVEQQFGQVGAVLSGHAGDQCGFLVFGHVVLPGVHHQDRANGAAA